MICKVLPMDSHEIGIYAMKVTCVVTELSSPPWESSTSIFPSAPSLSLCLSTCESAILTYLREKTSK